MDVGAVDAVYAALQTTTPKELQAFVKKHFSASQRAIVELRHQPTPAAGSSK
jgi:hypothetical protein